jgi:ABC-type dipeptide/oligopeptide/nickel transport system permease subunit
MERWAANMLRTVGMVLTSLVTVLGSLFLLLLAMCAQSGGYGGGRHPEQFVPYLAAAVAVLVIGVFIIARLARGVYRSMREGEAQARQTMPPQAVPSEGSSASPPTLE